MKIAIAGATGFVGRALAAVLTPDHDVVALARRDPDLPGVDGRAVDVGDEAAAADALSGCDAAYYLVHSLDAGDFRARDRRIATAFGRAAGRAGVTRIVYLGGLGDDPSSEHLASRQEVGRALAMGGADVVELRAAVVLGAGSISFEMLRHLTERLPAMVCPRWVHTAIQPIALTDAVEYLRESLSVEPGVYEIGGADVTTYREMIDAYAEVRGLRERVVVDVPFLTPRLSSYWVDFVTPVNAKVSHALIESLVTEVVVRDVARTDAAFTVRPLGLRDAIRRALDDQLEATSTALLGWSSGLHDGVYAERVEVGIDRADADAIEADLDRVGGDLTWYGLEWGWRARMLAGRVMGERWKLGRPKLVGGDPAPPGLSIGTAVDWWVVAARAPRQLVLRGVGWFAGETWLGWRVDDGRLVQVGALRPKGVPGFLYWKLLQPVHAKLFARQAQHRIDRVRDRRSDDAGG